jgi:hypothetical protein
MTDVLNHKNKMTMANQNEQPKVLTALRKALATCNGVSDTVAVLYGANDSAAAASAFVGDSDVLASTLLCVLNHVGEGRATPAEMAITRAVLMAVAAADVQNKGALQETIDGHREDIKAGKVVIKKR